MGESPGRPQHNVWLSLALVTLSTMCAGFSITFPFPFAPDMILRFGYREEVKGFYVGLVVSSLFLGRCIGGYPMGLLSDSIGRRPIMILSPAIVGSLDLVFGFAQSLPVALLTRLISGTANSIQGVQNALIYDVCDNSNQGLGMVLSVVGWGMGVFCGPLIAGYLAEPADKYQHVFPPEGLFGKHPFLLPSLLTAIFLWSSSLLNLILLDETKAFSPKQQSKQESIVQRIFHHTRKHSRADMEKHKLDCTDGQQLNSRTTLIPKEKKETGCLSNSKLCRLLRIKEVRLTIGAESIQGFSYVGLEDAVTIWSSTVARLGGLHFRPDQIGRVIGLASLPMFVLTPLIFPPLEKWLGAKKVAQYTIMVHIFLIPILPTLRCLHSSSTAQMAILSTLMGIESMLSMTTVSAINILAINAVRREDTGAANGIRATLSAFCRGAAPTLGGAIFAWSINNGAEIGFPFDVNLVFIMYSFFFLLSNICVTLIPEELNKQRFS